MADTLVRVTEKGTTVVIYGAAIVREMIEAGTSAVSALVTAAEGEADEAATSADNAAGSATAAGNSASDAAESATAAAGHEVGAQNANGTAQDAAAEAANTLAAALAALGSGGTLPATFQRQPATRTALAAITGQAAGSIAYLTEQGRHGIWEWKVGNYSAAVTFDTRQGRFVASAANPSGSAGVWERKTSAGLGLAEWFGAAGDGVTADQGAINAALALYDVVELQAKVYALSGPVLIPTGKELRGVGRNKTTVIALPNFTRLTVENALIASTNTKGVRLSDMTVDGSKVYNAGGAATVGNRINATMFRICEDFSVERVHAFNATGYGHYHAGPDGSPGRNGTWRDCTGANCNVIFEAMNLQGGGFFNCEALSGDNDIPREVGFHALNGTSNFTFSGCRADLNGGFGLSLVPVAAQKNIIIDNCAIKVIGGSSAFIVDGAAGQQGLYVTNSHFEAAATCAQITNTTRGRFSNCSFIGKQVGLELGAGEVEINGCLVSVAAAGAGAQCLGIIAESPMTVNGGRIDVVANAAEAVAFAGPVVLNGTVVSAADHTLIRGLADASYTLAIGDSGKVLSLLSTATVTVPPNSGVAFPVGTIIDIVEANAGTTTTIVPGSGVTIYSAGGSLVLGGDKATARLRKIALNSWQLTGVLA